MARRKNITDDAFFVFIFFLVVSRFFLFFLWFSKTTIVKQTASVK